MRELLKLCLIVDHNKRPDVKALLEHNLIKKEIQNLCLNSDDDVN
jgi:hypothetical protein